MGRRTMSGTAKTAVPSIDWHLYKEEEPISTFTPKVLAKVNMRTSQGIEPYVKLQLQFGKEQGDPFVIPLDGLDGFDWLMRDPRCILNPPYRRSREFIANVIRAGYQGAEDEEMHRLDRSGIHCLGNAVLYVAGDLVITRSSDEEAMPAYELAPSPHRLDTDTDRYYPRAAFEGMKEIIRLSPEAGRPLVAHSILGLTRSAYKKAGATPDFTLELTEESGKFKTYYSATVTQFYNRADGVKPVTRLNSSDRSLEEILYDFCECTVVFDDRCEVESNKIKRNNDDTTEEIMRRVGDGAGRSRMHGKTRVQFDPRSNVVITSEYSKGSKSTIARGLMVNPTTPIDNRLLDKYQRQHPLLVSTFYFYFLEWYVSHYESICTEIADRLTKFRETVPKIHPRFRQTQFCLHTAYMLFLQFCKDSGFIKTEEALEEYVSFGTQLVGLIRAQHARINPYNEHAETVDYLKLIRNLLKSDSFRLADSVEKFDLNKHDGLFYYDCLCIRRENLERRIRKIFRGVKINEVIEALLAKGALKLDKEGYTVKISGLRKPRFYAIWLEMLE